MALFLPVLRLLMLFLNVYDSYKTLKDPPPSSRHSGRPSVRAVSQRKRDMKGCLAVWIVWASLSIYERTVESLICLFIPFYDEIKSLVLLFLILTRARGAEPIYLHLIRPLIKPYTGTLDATLELALMIGDFIFALSTYPIRVALDWYKKFFGSYSALLVTEETESESSPSSNDVNTSEVATSFLDTSGIVPVPSDIDIPQLPKTSVQVKTRMQPPSRRTSGDATASRQTSSKQSSTRKRSEVATNANLEPNFFDSKKARDPLNLRSGSSSEKVAKPPLHHRSSGSPNRPASKASKHTRESAEGSSSLHQIWYPPSSSYEDEDRHVHADQTIRAKPVEQDPLLTLEYQQYEEWRQYPAFPSAYPPTPLATTSALATISVAAPLNLHPTIAEETQQDFRQSLLPPREPLNPNHAGDLSDRHSIYGITSPDVDDADDSMSTDDEDGYEDEDEFNITLRTPLPPFGSLRSQIQPRRLVSLPSTSSALSVPSRSSALTTADNGSSLPLGTSSDSSAPKPSLSPSVIGKKRSYPRSKMPLISNRVRQIEDETSQDPSSSDHDLQDVTTTLKNVVRKSSSSLLKLTDESAAASPSSLSAAELQNQEPQDQIPPEEKRRKIVRSVRPTRAIHPSRPVRPRVPRITPLPPHSKKGKAAVLPGATINSVPIPSFPGSNVDKVKENDASLSASSASVSDAPRPRIPSRPPKRASVRKL
ncbi:hypothetical protein JR316_0004288 [Psilocybe cubensis]|uniref:Uncharacterized protein n=2 Tax=Psilocybe cubensis TaxID=181762 RepID=A0ACB8H2H0_PSICU|nr:hypothetical protein JR316_0004288 [Psilocybe cubensis]KAH9482193.1 hypothetical protein JR316_0004288 [Psilocybe cubensis]